MTIDDIIAEAARRGAERERAAIVAMLRRHEEERGRMRAQRVRPGSYETLYLDDDDVANVIGGLAVDIEDGEHHAATGREEET